MELRRVLFRSHPSETGGGGEKVDDAGEASEPLPVRFWVWDFKRGAPVRLFSPQDLRSHISELGLSEEDMFTIEPSMADSSFFLQEEHQISLSESSSAAASSSPPSSSPLEPSQQPADSSAGHSRPRKGLWSSFVSLFSPVSAKDRGLHPSASQPPLSHGAAASQPSRSTPAALGTPSKKHTPGCCGLDNFWNTC